jgi:hypothetical protein
MSDAQDLSFLEANADTSAAAALIADVKTKLDIMRTLQAKMVEAEAAYKHASEEFEHYKASVVVAAFTNAGITYLEDANGNTIKLETKYYCNPNKNDQDRAIIAKWLTDHQGAFLLKHEGKVDGAQLEALKKSGIPYQDKIDVNTTSLKAYLKGALGLNGGTAQITMEEIPECMHFVTAFDVVTK